MREHGTRACYVFGPQPGGDRSNGCRCEPCSAANRADARERDRATRRPDAHVEPAYVDASEASAHLRWLRTVGVGLRTVAQQSGVSRSSLSELRSGRRTKATKRTISKILAVGRYDARDGTLVDGRQTWKLIDDLLAHGWTRTAIAAELGSTAKTPALQIRRDQVLAGTARKVEAVHRRELAAVNARRQAEREARAAYRTAQRSEAAA